jgi:hypothetical protein
MGSQRRRYTAPARAFRDDGTFRDGGHLPARREARGRGWVGKTEFSSAAGPPRADIGALFSGSFSYRKSEILFGKRVFC